MDTAGRLHIDDELMNELRHLRELLTPTEILFVADAMLGAAGLDDLTYLDRMYAFGAAPFFDVAAANGYGLWTGPDDRQLGAGYTNLSRLLLVRDVMARHGDAGKPLWVSEFGWNAEPPGWDGRPSPWGRVDEATKASWLRAGLASAALAPVGLTLPSVIGVASSSTACTSARWIESCGQS